MHDFSHLKEWFKLPDETKLRIFTETGRSRGLLPFAVEKDWWVVHTLAVIYTMDCAGSLVFKGGTAIYHCYLDHVRFSKDLDFTSRVKLRLSDAENLFSDFESKIKDSLEDVIIKAFQKSAW